ESSIFPAINLYSKLRSALKGITASPPYTPSLCNKDDSLCPPPEDSERGLPKEPFTILDQVSNERLCTGSAPPWHAEEIQLFAKISAILNDSKILNVLSTAGGCSVMLSEQLNNSIDTTIINTIYMSERISFI